MEIDKLKVKMYHDNDDFAYVLYLSDVEKLLREKDKELSELKENFNRYKQIYKHSEADVINAIKDNLDEDGDDEVQQLHNYKQATMYYYKNLLEPKQEPKSDPQDMGTIY